MDVRPLAFLSRSQGPSSKYFSYKLAPNLQTLTTFCSFIQIQRNQRPLLCYDSLYPENQLKHVLQSLKFEFKQFLFELRLIVT